MPIGLGITDCNEEMMLFVSLGNTCHDLGCRMTDSL